jgi:TetR/AcrR family transcriptional regulator, cholesterol catabolism regulator
VFYFWNDQKEFTVSRLNSTGESARVAISRAALELFSTKGYDATGIREIGALAGVSSSVLYHYLDSKADALHELVRDGLDRHLRASELAAASVDLPEEKLAALIGVHVVVPVLHPQMSSLLQPGVDVRGWGDRLGIKDLRDRTLSIWTDVLADGRDQTIFEFESLAVVRSALVRSSTQLNQWYRPDGEITLEQLVVQFIDLGLGAVRARRGRTVLRAARLTHPSPQDLVAIVQRTHSDVWW